MQDPVLDTLLRPFDDGLIDWPAGPALFLRARYGAALSGVDRARLICEQSFKPEYDRLKPAGFALRDPADTALHPLVIVLPPRQREEYRALLARAVATAEPGGTVLACVSNLEGAKTVENDLKALCGNVASLSKNKCRAFWATTDAPNADLVTQWLALDAPRPILDGRFVSRPGLFAWDRIDAGSKRLAEHLPLLSGHGADLGGGFGYLSDEVLRRNPGVRIDLYEAEQRAVELSESNLKVYGERVSCHWRDVTKGIDGAYDFIVSNPPFHAGRADLPELGQAFIRAAAAGLKPGGSLYMVANRHLPYEAGLKGAFKSVVALHEDRDYKVYRGIK
ncbi:class I SAM-dependent methyltransferase [Asticcacaulis sp. AND118]|uniref:class I SAM-dependent methyltransferase n=1 Tax=Asticcacaulis sp. AND118 TaxID=2840468 RepID=UPI001CFFB424|nr:class I SAM-dependent methyltransferase [Asticcacaulis sp. AND118]UDF02801.1 class I SAM-dependent methyltransferase [Asticcacaulis sp. AND118]